MLQRICAILGNKRGNSFPLGDQVNDCREPAANLIAPRSRRSTWEPGSRGRGCGTLSGLRANQSVPRRQKFMKLMISVQQDAWSLLRAAVHCPCVPGYRPVRCVCLGDSNISVTAKTACFTSQRQRAPARLSSCKGAVSTPGILRIQFRARRTPACAYAAEQRAVQGRWRLGRGG